MISPENIDLSSLPWVPLDATAGFPAQPGIYFAIDSQQVVQYIGRSGDVRGRWKSHHKYEDLTIIGGVKIAYLFVDEPKLLSSIEKALIQFFNPPLNFMLKKRTQFPKVAYKPNPHALELLDKFCRNEFRSRNAQMDRVIFFYAAFNQLVANGQEITFSSVSIEVEKIRKDWDLRQTQNDLANSQEVSS